MKAESGSIVALGLSLLLATGCGPTPPTIVERASFKGHSREIVSIAVSPDGKTLATRGGDAVKLWNLAEGSEVASFPTDGADFASVAFSPDGKILAENRIGVGVAARDLSTGQERIYAGNQGLRSDLSTRYGWGVAFSPDAKTIVAGGSRGGDDGILTSWNAAEGVATDRNSAGGPITTVAFSPDGRTIASGNLGGDLVFWDAGGRRERLRIGSSRSYLAPVVFSPDGRVVASSNEARWVKLWEVSSGSEVATLKAHVKAVLSLAFSPDGKTLVSGDSSGTIFVWDLGSKKMAARLPSDRGKLWGLAFTPDGRTLISAGEDRLIHLWDVSWPNPAAR